MTPINPGLLRVLLVDDEPAARRNLRRLLDVLGGTEVVGEAGDGRSAVERIAQGDIDLVLLDVRMPELDGFGVVRHIGVDRMPPVVFVTAFDDQALQAFEVNAVGYVLKPVQQARLAEVLRRVKSSAVRQSQSQQLQQVLDALRPEQCVTRLAVKSDGRTTFVRTRDIDRIEADNVTARIHAGGRVYALRETLSSLERILSRREFIRVHRSVIVRVDRVTEVQPWFRGEYVLIMRDGARVTTGPTYRANVQRLLKHG